jgi:hypothetical protein
VVRIQISRSSRQKSVKSSSLGSDELASSYVGSIAGDIVKRKRLARLRARIESLRGRGAVPSRELERVARALGRRRHSRGSEPTWVSDLLPNARPLSIPHHSRDLNRFTARCVLDQLEADVDELENRLGDQEEPRP